MEIYITIVISTLSIVLVLYDRWVRWKNRKPFLYHDNYSNQKLRRYRQARFIVWDGKGYPINEDAPENHSLGFVFTLMSRSSEPVEIYDINFGYLSVRKSSSDSRLASSVTLPFMLKPYDYQHFRLTVAGELERLQLLDTWNSRKNLWFMPSSNINSVVEVRTSQGAVKASIRGFSKADIFRRRLNHRFAFWRAKTFKSSGLKPLNFLLDEENWWEK